MEYKDVNNEPIKPGFYVETFYKGKDESGNRIIYIEEGGLEGNLDLFSVINKANIIKLNSNYSRWLKPFDQEIGVIKGEIFMRDFISESEARTELCKPPTTG